MNNSNRVDSSAIPTCPFSVYIFYTTAMAVISLAAFLGNILVTFVVYKTPSLRTSTNFYYVNMAVSDFLCCVTSWPMYLTDEIIANRGSLLQGFLATISCKVGVYFKVVSAIVSILNLLLIAVDRCIATAFPLKATLITRKLRASLLFATWFISLVHCIPLFHYHTVKVVGEIKVCRLAWNGLEVSIYFISAMVVYSLAPFIAIIIIYSRIMRVLKRGKTKPDYGTRGNKLQQKRGKQQQHNVMKIFKSIVVAYFVCHLPYGVFFILPKTSNILNNLDKCRFIRTLCYYLLSSLSTAINPIILFTFSTNFRQALQNLCPFLQRKCRLCFQVSRQLEDVSLPELVTYKKTSDQYQKDC